ncbi:MAG: YbhB/YbcL family Raf kinase inhibitor-like protein [Candidatus Pacebacteria bacterium]|nr:YbhB/YbcL family Raf kinase inhibitor-like protein [Candidatus Paceibacterota bacterium]
MIITSPSFSDGDPIPKKFTCDGGSINPELQIQNVPEGAGSLALIVHDPDAPREGGFTHWVVWNIDPRTVLIKEESVPPGAIEGVNGLGHVGYVPPCPPPGHGSHRYHFQLYALDAMLDIPEGATEAELVDAMQGHLRGEAELVGSYTRAE